MKTPKLKPVDLSKCCECPNGDGNSWHTDISSRKHYLAKIGSGFYCGRFNRVWYGWSFNGWGGGGGLQLDKPGTNASEWKGLWEITE